MAAAKAAARKLTKAQREQRRRASSTHGAGSYLARTAGPPATEAPKAEPALITETMALVESAIMARHAECGPRGLVETNALRFETAAELLWRHMQTDRTAFESGLKTWGWLAGAAVRAWRDYTALPGSGETITPARVLESLK